VPLSVMVSVRPTAAMSPFQTAYAHSTCSRKRGQPGTVKDGAPATVQQTYACPSSVCSTSSSNRASRASPRQVTATAVRTTVCAEVKNTRTYAVGGVAHIGFDLVFANELQVCAVSHPSLLQLEDLEVRL
jgi:hypothetical protein